MIKFIGIVFLFIASSFLGLYFSDSIRHKKERLVLIRKILSEISELIRWNSFTMSEIVLKLSENNEFSKQEFIKQLPEILHRTRSFPDIWQKAILSDKSISDSERQILLDVGSNLGTTDTDGQLSSLKFYILQVDKMIAEETEKYKIKGKMYRSMGVTIGAMIGILMI